MSWPTDWTPEVHQELLKPYPAGVEQWRENRFAYIEARDVMGRLDEVVGPGGWSFTPGRVLHQNENGVAMEGHLTVLGITKSDVGEHWRASERDKVEIYKSAASDALKRAAVHFGVGRYLYELETARAGKMTEAERDEAARKVGYINQPREGDPEIQHWCAQCGDVVEPKVAAISLQKFGKVLCIPDGKALLQVERANIPVGTIAG